MVVKNTVTREMDVSIDNIDYKIIHQLKEIVYDSGRRDRFKSSFLLDSKGNLIKGRGVKLGRGAEL